MKEKMGKKGIIKRLLSVALAVALVVGMMPFNSLEVKAADSTTPESGTFTDNPSAGWTFNSTTGELKITGTGSAGHLKDHTDIKSVVIEAGITALGINSFCGCSNLSSVTFESGSAVETIGDYAFLGTAIESITIPSTVTSIGSGAFRDCSSLKTVDFEATAKINTIKSLTFYNSGITSITIPDSVTEIE